MLRVLAFLISFAFAAHAALLNGTIFVATSGGTGSFGVAVPVVGFMTPHQAGVVDGQTYSYRAQSSDLKQWELGQATSSASGTVFSRLPSFTSDAQGPSGVAVNFTSPPTIIFTELVSDFATLPSGPYIVTGGTTSRQDKNRWVDNFVEAPDIGVDCTGSADSTAAIQAFFTATPGGHLMFPYNCSAIISSTITISNASGTSISGPTFAGDGAALGSAPHLFWGGLGGGPACDLSNFANCVYMFDFESVDHPVVQNIAMQSFGNTADGYLCPDGFLKFDGQLGGFTGTNGRITGNSFSNGNCRNPRFVAINISPTAGNNQEDYVVSDNTISCSGSGTFSNAASNGVTNGTTTVTSASNPFVAGHAQNTITAASWSGGLVTFTTTNLVDGIANTVVTISGVTPAGYNGNWFVSAASGHSLTVFITKDPGTYSSGGVKAGERIRLSYAGGVFDTTISAFVSSSNVTLPVAVPFSQSNVLIKFNSLGFGIGIRNGTSQNAIQQQIIRLQYSGCAYGIYMAGGNAQMVQPSGGASDTGIYIAGFSAQNMLIDFYASESDAIAIFLEGSFVNPTSITNSRFSNANQLASGMVNLASWAYFANNLFSFYLPSANSQLVGGFSTIGSVAALGSIVPGSGYANGTYTGVKLRSSIGFNATATVTVAGGQVTVVTLTGGGQSYFPGDVVTAQNTDLGGSGSGFSTTVLATKTTGGTSSAAITSIGNHYAGGCCGIPPTWVSSGLASVTNGPLVSINDQVDAATMPGTHSYSCSQATQPCFRINNSITNSGVSPALDLFITNGAVTSNTDQISLRTASDMNSTTNGYTGISVIPSTGRLATFMTAFEASNNLVSPFDPTFGLSVVYSFRARTPGSVAGTIANFYAFYCDKQKVTNVTTGYCFYNADAADSNLFAGSMTMTGLGTTPGGKQPVCIDTGTGLLYKGSGGAC